MAKKKSARAMARSMGKMRAAMSTRRMGTLRRMLLGLALITGGVLAYRALSNDDD